MKEWAKLAKSDLAKLYQTRTAREIADLYGFKSDESVRKRLVSFGIPRRRRGGVREFAPPKAKLERLYQRHSMREIARMHGVGETVVWKRLKEYGIKLKDYEDGGHRKKPGRQFSREHRENLSKAHRGRWAGDKNPHWKGGVYDANLRLRRTGAYRQWKLAALEYRGNRCQQCGAQNGTACACCGHRITLHVHHILSFSQYPELRFDAGNSEVLCPKCHHSRHHGKSGEFGETL
jgi:5-methylcytosine-specific restriction endonuclease McrA